MTRREARELLFSIIFERSFNTEPEIADFYALALVTRDAKGNDYVKNGVFAIDEKRDELDKIADKYFENWDKSRISPVSRAIIRLETYELKYTDIPPVVAINEGIELSKKFDDEKAKNFVNGILNSIAKEITKEKENG